MPDAGTPRPVSPSDDGRGAGVDAPEPAGTPSDAQVDVGPAREVVPEAVADPEGETAAPEAETAAPEAEIVDPELVTAAPEAVAAAEAETAPTQTGTTPTPAPAARPTVDADPEPASEALAATRPEPMPVMPVPAAAPAAPADPAGQPDAPGATTGEVPPAAAPAGSRIGRVPAAVLAALALLAVLGTGYLAWQVRQEARTDAARREGLEAARDAARVLFSYDHTRLEEDFANGMELATGDFREEYERTTREVVTPVATQYDAVVEAEVVEAAVVSAAPERLVALVYVNQSTTSTRVEGPKIDQSRVRMSLRRDGDQWLVERVDAL